MRRKKKRTRVRKLTVGVFHAETSPNWGNSSITIIDGTSGKDIRKVVLKIERPGDLTYLEEQFEKIRAFWKAQLGG